MKRVTLILIFSFVFHILVAQRLPYQNSSLPVKDRVNDLLARMTLEEKVAQMCQYVGIEHQIESYKKNKGKDPDPNDDASSFYRGISFDSLRNMVRMGRIGSFLHVVTAKEANELQRLAASSRLKIPLLIGIDAMHGNALVSGSTVYPSPLGLASTFNPQLVEKLSVATAKEMRATGSHWTFTPNIDIARDPRWGRVGETFGEDPFLVSTMGVAMVKGLQGPKMTGKHAVVSCIKHLIGGGESINGLNGSPTDISERTLWEVHLPPYKTAISAGAFSVMTAHNELNGVPCHANKYLMNDILREKFGFSGFIVSDWMDIERLNTVHHVAANQKEAVYQTLQAGMDMHMHGPGFLEPVVELVKEGKISESQVNRSAAYILEAKFKLGLFEDPYVSEYSSEKLVFTEEHKYLALQSARESIVLLQNDKKLLPLSNKPIRILVTGPNANNQTILGDWSLPQPDQNVITIYEGIKELAPTGSVVDYLQTGSVKKLSQQNIDIAAKNADAYDLVIAVVGENSLRYETKEKTSGENIDRDNIELYGLQSKFIQALVGAGKPVITVLVNSRPLATEEATRGSIAILEAWEPGSMGGIALAEILFGKVNPSGKLPISIPRSTGQIPTYYNHKPSNYFHKYIETKSSPLYEFGFGLSYTQFSIDTIWSSKNKLKKDESVTIYCKLTNKGSMAGDEVVQVYVRDEVSTITRPVKELRAFQRIHITAGETRNVSFVLNKEDFSLLDANMHSVVEAGEFTVSVGNSSAEPNLKKIKLTIE